MENLQVAQGETQAERWARYRTLEPELHDWQCAMLDAALSGHQFTWRIR